MKTIFRNKKISGILGILPETISYFDDEVDNYTFPPKQTMRLKKIMGYESHRLSKETSFASDFCKFGIDYLLNHKMISKDEIGAIVVVTLSPDYFLPQISNIIHGEFGFGHDVLCMDIPQGCCGFLMGLMQAFMLLEHLDDKKVLLCNVDVLSKKVSSKDRNDYPLAGDGAAITLVENCKQDTKIHYIMNMDGARCNALRIPAGGFRQPNTPQTAKLKDLGDGNFRALDHMHMDGTAVFNFVQSEVPPCIHEIIEYSGNSLDEINYFLFHQPNKFMLQKLREKLGVNEERLFIDLVTKYGNPSGASIPLVITDNLKNQMLDKKHLCCLSAFGSGLAWGAMILRLGDLKFCQLVEAPL